MRTIKPKILKVEDETAIRNMLRFVLTPAGFEIIAAEHVSSAEKFLAKKPDLIIVELKLINVG